LLQSFNVIDLHSLSSDETQILYPEIYQWLFEKVKPKRDTNSRKTRREKWWLFAENQPKMRSTIKGLNRFIATIQTGKHKFFSFLDAEIIPDDKLIVIGVDDLSIFGVLNSRVHVAWALRAGSRLGVGNDPVYNKTSCFEKFPFPDLTEHQRDTISDLSDKIDKHRKQQQAQHPKLTLTNIYNVMEKLRKEEALNQKEQLINQQGLVTILRELHDELDRQVFAAYGWQDLADALVGKAGATTPLPDKSDEQALAEEELLSRLVALNHQRAAEEKNGEIRWLRPDYQNPDAKVEEQAKQTDMALTDTPNTKEKNNVSKAPTKATWPKILSEQVAAVVELLETPATCEQVAENFKRKPIKQVQPVLEALEALGRAQLLGGIWELI
tara:strand:- start:5878 stop:7026 length:1149 start_codon:yes stop_codon:yes gene_type:complete